MFAIVESGGKQVKAMPGQYTDIEKLVKEKGEKISFNNILMLVNGNAKETKVGNPYVKGAIVYGHIVDNKKAKKVIVYKMRPKKGTRKKQGHRQWVTRVFIDNIELDGKIIAKAEEIKKIEREKERSKESKKRVVEVEKSKLKKKTTIKKEE